MLHGVIIYPGEPDDVFIASLYTIRRVKWEVVFTTLEGQNHGVQDEVLSLHSNLVIVMDANFTTYGYLSDLVRRGCHLFLTERQRLSFDERVKLIQLAEEGNTFIQIRNDLLFHPSLSTLGKGGSKSKLIEIHHVAPGKTGSIQELMYSNLLMILRLIDSEPSRISVCSIPNSGYQPDVVNLHLDFHNGSAASLTLSFTGDKKEHLLSVHSADGVKTYNFKENEHFQSSCNQITESTQIFSDDLLFRQIANFADSILKKTCKNFGLSEETRAFLLIEKINRKLEFSSVLI
jgi:hypothetical protein